MKLILCSQIYSISQLSSDDPPPNWVFKSSFYSISKTTEELSIVCEHQLVPDGIKSEKNWRLFQVEGPLDFTLTGILASIVSPLAKSKVSLFSISTFDTDYILVKSQDLKTAMESLECAGFSLVRQ